MQSPCQERGLIMKDSKTCTYRKINEKKQALNIVIIKTFNLHNNYTSNIKQSMRICSYKKLNGQRVQHHKSRDQVDENLRHYARIVIQPEFDKVFSEISSLQDSSMLTQTCQPNKIQTYEIQQKLNISDQSNSNTYIQKNIKSEQEDEEFQFTRLKTKTKDVICIQLGENQNVDFSNDLNNDYSGEIMNYKSSNFSSIDTSKTINNFSQYKHFPQDDNEVYTIYGRINSILEINQDLYQSMLRNYDFSIFQMSIKPQNEQYFITNIVHIFQSFTKKHRAPYKMVSRQSKKKSTSSHSSGSSDSNSHQNQIINDHEQQRDKDFKQQDDYDCINDLESECSSLNFNDKKFSKIKKERNNTMRQSKFHNLKKSFMHALILLFQSDILGCLELSENHSQYLQSIINRMRAFSTKTRSGNGQYEYYSHTHYTALLLKLNQYSIPLITQNQSDLQLHYAMFLEDLSASTGTDKSSIKCNFYKSLIFKIIQMSISIVEKQNNLLSNIECETKSVSRFDYIIRVKSGIEKLNQGIQVTRF